jgi:cytochrome bd-type quinol oxidase subunit 2
MRWKLLIIASLVAAIIGCALWCAFSIGLYGSAAAMARNDWILLCSSVFPLSVTVVAGFFVYRHTARRRKTQAVVTVLLALLLTPVTYLAAWSLFPNKLYIPTTYEVRHAR